MKRIEAYQLASEPKPCKSIQKCYDTIKAAATAGSWEVRVLIEDQDNESICRQLVADGYIVEPTVLFKQSTVYLISWGL